MSRAAMFVYEQPHGCTTRGRLEGDSGRVLLEPRWPELQASFPRFRCPDAPPIKKFALNMQLRVRGVRAARAF
jgi:hypothetical protein